MELQLRGSCKGSPESKAKAAILSHTEEVIVSRKLNAAWHSILHCSSPLLGAGIHFSTGCWAGIRVNGLIGGQ